jgi:hypothetical protein
MDCSSHFDIGSRGEDVQRTAEVAALAWLGLDVAGVDLAQQGKQLLRRDGHARPPETAGQRRWPNSGTPHARWRRRS